MAIKAKITTTQGVELEQAYINLASSSQIIKERQGDGTNKYKISANASVYSNKTYYDTCITNKITPVPIEGFSVVCDLDLTKNVLEQAYAELQINTRLVNIFEA